MNSIGLEKAKLYEKYRLPYAREAVEHLCKTVTAHEMIADIGAGTGQLARLFADKSKLVYVVEPDPAMREVAALSLAAFSNIELRAATAEQTTIADKSIDLIVIGNAFHRFKSEAINEMKRILKSQGWVALFSYNFADKAFAETLFSKLAELKLFAERIDKNWPQLPVQALFGECQTFTSRYLQSHTEDWIAFWGAACSGIEAPVKGDTEFAEFERINREVFDTFAVEGQLTIHYETCVLFGQLNCR